MTATSANHGLSVATSDTNRYLALPLQANIVVTNRFNDSGSRPYYDALGQHAPKGIDFDCTEGDSVYAMNGGKIAAILYHLSSLGLHMIIRSSTGADAGSEHTYAHLADFGQITVQDAEGNDTTRYLRVGDEVNKGAELGLCGSTGNKLLGSAF